MASEVPQVVSVPAELIGLYEQIVNLQKRVAILESNIGCPYCGEIGGTAVKCEDTDSSAGYSGVETRCTLCVNGGAR